ncbi:MAG: NUDIX domain-containing protein [bacterium]
MKLLQTIYDQDIFPDYVEGEKIEYRKREAARAIVVDDQGLIALMNVSNCGYHKLPGGGLQDDEGAPTALARELLEEIGCKAIIQKEVGEIIEYRNEFNQVHYNYCFIAKLTGEKGEPNLEDDEIENGFKIMWVSIDEAIKLLSTDIADNYHGKFVLARDLIFLTEAKKIL